MNVTGSYYQLVNIGLGNGLVSSGITWANVDLDTSMPPYEVNSLWPSDAIWRLL